MKGLSMHSPNFFSLLLHSVYEKNWENLCIQEAFPCLDNIKVGAVKLFQCPLFSEMEYSCRIVFAIRFKLTS